MSGESDSSATYWTVAAAKVNWLKLLITVINLIFGVYYIFLTIWLTTLFLFYVIFLPSDILIFWLSQRKKTDEFHDMSRKEIAANDGIVRDIIALFGNLVILIYLLIILFTTILEDFNFIVLYSPMFIAILTNFEILGSSMAYIQVIRNWNDRPE